jgi:precorrin-6A/cobalt-precorrin-6A reductase
MSATVLLLSGTSEGPALARGLLGAGFAVWATVTRDEAVEPLFAALRDRIAVEAGGLPPQTLRARLERGEVDLVLDATHPHAARITRHAQAVCAELGTPYVRYERPSTALPTHAHRAATFAEAAARIRGLGMRPALTIGAKPLKHFAHLHAELAMQARVLPSETSVAQARAAGFDSRRLVCVRPPVSEALNHALFAAHGADLLVTKDSGAAGGVPEKLAAAGKLGMAILAVERPAAGAEPSARSMEEAVRACLRHKDGPARAAESEGGS